MFYCRTCDLAFCSKHANEHDATPLRSLDRERAHDVEERSDVSCCICNGIYRPRAAASD